MFVGGVNIIAGDCDTVNRLFMHIYLYPDHTVHSLQHAWEQLSYVARNSLVLFVGGVNR